MKNQFSHKDEKGYREQSEGRNGRENSCHCPNKAWYPPQEEIRGNHIDNEKGKGNGYPCKQQENHATKKQRNDQPPFHGLLPCFHINKSTPRHSEEFHGKKNKPNGDDDKKADFRDGISFN